MRKRRFRGDKSGITELLNSGFPALQSYTQTKSKNSYSLDNGDLINSKFIHSQSEDLEHKEMGLTRVRL